MGEPRQSEVENILQRTFGYYDFLTGKLALSFGFGKLGFMQVYRNFDDTFTVRSFVAFNPNFPIRLPAPGEKYRLKDLKEEVGRHRSWMDCLTRIGSFNRTNKEEMVLVDFTKISVR
jgi:hypothetical protein